MNTKKVRLTGVPQESRVFPEVATAYFADAYQVMQKNDDTTALDVALRLASGTPAWFDFLMTTRNRIVGLFGLKNLGRLSAIDPNKPRAAYRVGDRTGIFSIVSMSENEVVLGDDDKHLHVHVSVYLDPKKQPGVPNNVTISTVVHVHNFLGRAYLFFVIPAHQLIVPPLLARLAK